MPASSGAPKWTLQHLRIERGNRGVDACRLAFGREMFPDGSPHAARECGHWLVKDLGTRVAVIQSQRKKMELLNDRSGWVDPYAYRQRVEV